MKNNMSEGKKKSKLSPKEKRLLTGVGAVAVLTLGGLGINNLATKRGHLKEKYETLQSELDSKQAKINQKPTLIKQLTKLNGDVFKQATNYYGNTNQGEFIYLIDDFINKSQIVLQEVHFEETTELDIPGEDESTNPTPTDKPSNYSSSNSSGTSSQVGSSSANTNKDQNVSGSSKEVGKDGKERYKGTNITQMTADINFTGTYTQVLKLLELIDQNDKTIVSSDLELDEPDDLKTPEEQTNPVQNGRIKLRFYQVKDVDRYVPKPDSAIEKTPIPFVHVKSPFMRPTWLVTDNSNEAIAGSGTMIQKDGLGSAMGNLGLGNGSVSPSYLSELSNLSANNGLSAYFNSSTVYRFETPLQLIKVGSKEVSEVRVDSTDLLEGRGSNVVEIPATKGTTLFEMLFSEPFVTLKTQPNNISFALSLSNVWQGKIGMIVKNSSGKKIYLHLVRPTNWTGWREIGFNPAGTSDFTYPMTIVGYYFETPSGDSPAVTLKLDNLAIHHLVTN